MATAAPPAAASQSATTSIAPSSPAPSDAELHECVAIAAYYLAQARGFVPGNELDDWLAAERAIAAQQAPSTP